MRVLVVESNEVVRDMAVILLEDAGFDVIEAPDAGSALCILQAGIAPDALLIDVCRRDPYVWVTARVFREYFPDRHIIYVTSFAEQMQPEPAGIVLPRPYSMAQVINILGTSPPVTAAGL